MSQSVNARRDFVKKAAYVAPAILTLAAVPSYAKFGSDKLDDGNNGNNGNNGNSALHAQSAFHANQNANLNARHGLTDFSVGSRRPPRD
jgi:hypothetical protein